MNKEENGERSWTFCQKCQGRGKKSRGLTRKVRLRYQAASEQYEKSKGDGTVPIFPKGHLYTCSRCGGSGILQSTCHPIADEKKYPHVAIIGAGIGGVALAVACLHRGIPFTLFERDTDFYSRSPGYGLTLQQARKAIEGLGVFSLKEGVVSTRHVVHTTEGKVIGEWGDRKSRQSGVRTASKHSNIHIARQSLRLALLEQLGGPDLVHWGHQLIDFTGCEEKGLQLSFLVGGDMKSFKADLLVGADGIRSSVRRLLLGDKVKPLRYLGCIVILGICPLHALHGLNNPLLDSATVFQTANGNERIYVMPYNADSLMWQLSFPMSEKDAKALSELGPRALKEEACRRTPWHDPIPQIITSTLETRISGYPVYDRELLESELSKRTDAVTLIGDAAHPMSPFKGQGANQALLDAIALARGIFRGCQSIPWAKAGLREHILTAVESEMLVRSASKVTASADAAQFLHSAIVLHESDQPRGQCLKKK